MNAGACLTLATFYGAVWFKQRANRAYLLFSCTAIAAAVISAFELWMLNAMTVRAIPSADALDPCAGVGAHAVPCRFCPTLPTRRTIVAGVEHLRPANSGVDSQFRFSGEYQLQQDHRHPPLFMGRPDDVSACRHPEYMGFA